MYNSFNSQSSLVKERSIIASKNFLLANSCDIFDLNKSNYKL